MNLPSLGLIELIIIAGIFGGACVVPLVGTAAIVVAALSRRNRNAEDRPVLTEA